MISKVCKREEYSYDPVMRDILEKKALNTGNREDVEKALAETIKCAWELYKKLNPDGRYLTFCIIDDNESLSIMANNALEHEDPMRVDIWENYTDEAEDE